MRMILISFILLVQSQYSVCFAQAGKSMKTPDAQLAVGAKEQVDGKPGKSIYLFTLKCNLGECTLTTVRIHCENYSSSTRDSSFRPETWYSSTTDGSLKVQNLGDRLEVSEILSDYAGETQSSFVFGYSTNDSTQLADKVTSFSGGSDLTIRYSDEVQKVTYIPFVGSQVFVPLDCNTLWLPGIDTTK